MVQDLGVGQVNDGILPTRLYSQYSPFWLVTRPLAVWGRWHPDRPAGGLKGAAVTASKGLQGVVMMRYAILFIAARIASDGSTPIPGVCGSV